MPGMQLQQGWQGDRAACCPEGGWKGAPRVEGASRLASSSPQGPLVLGGAGPGGTVLFPGQFALGSGNLLIPRPGEARDKRGGAWKTYVPALIPLPVICSLVPGRTMDSSRPGEIMMRNTGRKCWQSNVSAF